MTLRLLAWVPALMCVCGVMAVVFVLRSRLSNNKCNMTYMYRVMYFMCHIDYDSQQFHRLLQPIAVPTDPSLEDDDPAKWYSFSTNLQSYSTVLYGEGSYASNYLSTGKVSGIPVIFVPGNGGSARQVRSLGSLLHNKTESLQSPFTFDVFAVDFNEELTGISGMYLERQIRYVELVVEYVWQLYSPRAEGIIFVAHSMGGVVVRSLLRDPRFDTSRIAFIITLATPHTSPSAPFDDFLENAYVQMKSAWNKRAKELSILRVVSISGGLRDALVPDELTDDTDLIHFSTAGIDGVEVEADHLCIVWCNQLVRVTSRLLFEYASSPMNFNQNADRIIHRVFSSSRYLYENKSADTERYADGAEILIGRLPSVTRNLANISSRHLLSISAGDWVFISLAASSSYLLVNDQPFNGMHTLGKHEYCLLPANDASKSSIVLHPGDAIRVVAVFEDAFVEMSLNEWICVSGVSRVEFRSRGSRRVSDRSGSVDSVVGFSSNGIDKDALVLFIVDPQCDYRATLQTSYAYTLQLVLRKNVFMTAFHTVAYVMCAFIASTVLKEAGSRAYASDGTIFILTGLFYACFIATSSMKDWMFATFCGFIICGLVSLLQEVSVQIIPCMLFISNKCTTEIRCFGLKPFDAFLLTCLFIIPAANGFIMLTILALASIMEVLRRNLARDVSEIEGRFSQLVLLVVVHLLMLMCFGPFCACSVWNVLKYGLGALSVYEDPARIPAYMLCVSTLLRSVFDQRSFASLRWCPAVILPHLASATDKTTFSHLGKVLIATIAVMPFSMQNPRTEERLRPGWVPH
uniref:GPI inositol-deacylase n=1 Tax=Ascaris lumbricoides TaxID=6252 RepID=A0A9J2P5U3_ASCLU